MESDSGDDLGGFKPTTPHPPPKRTTRSQKNVKPNGRIAAEVGQSSKSAKAPGLPVARKTAGHKAFRVDHDGSDVQEVVLEDEVEQVDADMADAEDEDIQMVDVATGKKGATPLAPIANGKPTGKGKGKAKVPAARSKKTSPNGDTIDVDAFQERYELDDDVNDVAQRAILVHAGGSKKDKDGQEVARLQEKLRRAHEQEQVLMEKLEESQRIRETEAKKMLKAMDEQYQADLRSKEMLVEALTSQIAQKEVLAQHGKHSILHMITREAADEEQRTLERDIARLREALAEKEQALKEKDGQITELRQIENELRYDLKAEIERSKVLSDKSLRTPQAAPRSRTAGVAFEDPKNAEVIRFYEDLTNLLVTNMKHQTGHRPGADEWIFKCIYTYSEDDMSSNDALKQSMV
ncbi:hypothetical protein AX14_009273 [Amanita brunnescens Koide BX004]|nr:hypothetical protein AX14_009273 [Amanita brunnescens Koide BX004]